MQRYKKVSKNTNVFKGFFCIFDLFSYLCNLKTDKMYDDDKDIKGMYGGCDRHDVCLLRERRNVEDSIGEWHS